jgi:hypothetical protein
MHPRPSSGSGVPAALCTHQGDRVLGRTSWRIYRVQGGFFPRAKTTLNPGNRVLHHAAQCRVLCLCNKKPARGPSVRECNGARRGLWSCRPRPRRRQVAGDAVRSHGVQGCAQCHCSTGADKQPTGWVLCVWPHHVGEGTCNGATDWAPIQARDRGACRRAHICIRRLHHCQQGCHGRIRIRIRICDRRRRQCRWRQHKHRGRWRGRRLRSTFPCSRPDRTHDPGQLPAISLVALETHTALRAKGHGEHDCAAPVHEDALPLQQGGRLVLHPQHCQHVPRTSKDVKIGGKSHPVPNFHSQLLCAGKRKCIQVD